MRQYICLAVWSLWMLFVFVVGSSSSALAVEPAPSLFVDDDNRSGSQDGSAARPFATVQQAVDAASGEAVIAVARGTYPQNIRVQEKTVRLYGGYLGATAADYGAGKSGDFTTREPRTNESRLKGDGKDSVVTLFDAGSTVVDGFTVSGGGRSKTAAPQWLGGGFYIYQGSPTISGNIIEKNQTCPPKPQNEEKLGGGIYATGASLTIVDNIIRDNVSGRGAGIAADGPKLVIRGNTVERNIGVSDHGGGVYIFSPDAEVSHNRIENNEIGRAMGYGWGGGLVVLNQGGVYKLSHNTFTGNFAPSVGSAIFVDDGAVATSDHDLVFANADNPKGDGAVPPVYVDGLGDGVVSALTMNHATIADHTSPGSTNGGAIRVTGGSRATVTNSILWNNGGGDVQTDETSKASITYSLTEQKRPGTGNLAQDPLFADPAARNYRLRSEKSPAIDAADPQAPFDLEPTPNGGRADLGVFGNTAEASKSER